MTEARTFLDGAVTLHPGDCLDVVRRLPDASIDSVVTDPPYALVSIARRFGKPGSAPPKGAAYERAAAGFMGKGWDTGRVAFSVAFWKEVLRVLKPGGFCLAFGGPRTVHRLATALEDAGFDIRDRIVDLICADAPVVGFLESLAAEQRAAFVRVLEESTFAPELLWIFGSGMVKAGYLAPHVDKRRREDLEPVRRVCRYLRAAMEAKGVSARALARLFGCHPRLVDHWAARDTDSQPSLPTPTQWQALKEALELDDAMDDLVARLNARKGAPGDAWTGAPIVGEHDGEPPGFPGMRFARRDRKIRALSEEAQRLAGLGKALKTAHEIVVVGRKPFSGTLVDTVLRHGVGAFRVDECRVPAADGGRRVSATRAGPGIGAVYSEGWKPAGERVDYRTPAEGRWPANVMHDGSAAVEAAFARFGDEEGSPARFFYSAKADPDSRLGSGHPTVKPLDLVRTLVRLVTPEGGLVLDPFAGTGTTGEAAFLEGRRAVLVELEATYQDDIARRLAHVAAGPQARFVAAAQARAMRGATRPRDEDAPPDLFDAIAGEG